MIVATNDFAIIESYLEGNAKIKISIKYGFHIRRSLTTVAGNLHIFAKLSVQEMDFNTVTAL